MSKQEISKELILKVAAEVSHVVRNRIENMSDENINTYLINYFKMSGPDFYDWAIRSAAGVRSTD